MTVHFARFERPFLHALAGDQPPPLDIVCTHDIAQHLLPDLRRRGLRALTGYFGRDPARSATQRQSMSSATGVSCGATWCGCSKRKASRPGPPSATGSPRLARAPFRPGQQRRRVWPMPRDVRLAAPRRAGPVSPATHRRQRPLRRQGLVAAESRQRLLPQAARRARSSCSRCCRRRARSTCEVTESTLEAALLEPDEIKRHRPPYNIALMTTRRERAPHLVSRRAISASATRHAVDPNIHSARSRPR